MPRPRYRGADRPWPCRASAHGRQSAGRTRRWRRGHWGPAARKAMEGGMSEGASGTHAASEGRRARVQQKAIYPPEVTNATNAQQQPPPASLLPRWVTPSTAEFQLLVLRWFAPLIHSLLTASLADSGGGARQTQRHQRTERSTRWAALSPARPEPITATSNSAPNATVPSVVHVDQPAESVGNEAEEEAEEEEAIEGC